MGVECSFLDKALFGLIAAVAFEQHSTQSGCLDPIEGSNVNRVPVSSFPAATEGASQGRVGDTSCSITLAEMDLAVAGFVADATAFVASIASGAYGASGKLLPVAQSIVAKHAWIAPMVAGAVPKCGSGSVCKKLQGLAFAMTNVHEWALNIVGNPSSSPEDLAKAFEGLDAAYLIDAFAEKMEGVAQCA